MRQKGSHRKNGKNAASFARVSALGKGQKSKGYDRLQYWTRMELRQLYQAEGYSTKQATRMARDLYEAVRNLNRREFYSWNKARELERPLGAKALDELGGRYSHDAVKVWSIIESMARQVVREVTHYERCRGQRIRLDPDVKRARAQVRREERRRQAEAREQEEFDRLAKRLTKLREG